jgi:hypothetical protein
MLLKQVNLTYQQTNLVAKLAPLHHAEQRKLIRSFRRGLFERSEFRRRLIS